MQNFPGYEIVERIDETLHSIVYRARKIDASETVIIKTLKSSHATPAEIARFKHEFELIRNTHIEGIVNVLDIIEIEGGIALVLEDFFGVSLKTFIRQEFKLDMFLDLSVRLAEILGNLHVGNITHKDIKPGNILYNAERDILKIGDFGIAAEFVGIDTQIYNPAIIEGTLAYMSPEQTGRMNCVVDYRTDLYSLGVTFYEMLAGAVPFRTLDPMEVIYSHIAKIPIPPCAINPDVPDIVSDIVMKLLAKASEDRYQNSFGLMADLKECLRQLRGKGKVEPFALGTHDVSLKFSLPQLLVGREDEVGILQDALDRVTSGAVAVMLVAGAPGVGKSTLVNEMNRLIVGGRGYFISGKYTQFQRQVPYSSIIQAFQSLAPRLLSESEARLTAWRERLRQALGANGKIITDAIPEIELIIGKQPEIPDLGPEETENRFTMVIKNFVRAFADPAHPLVLFLDDLQWADAASLNLIQAIIRDTSLSHFLLIGAYRDNETGPHHLLTLTLEEISKQGTKIKSLRIEALSAKNVTGMLASFLRCAPEMAAPLAEIVHAKTLGNPFFVNQFLKTLYEEKYLTLDAKSGWQWDAHAISQMRVTDNVLELMTAKIVRLSKISLDTMKVCACIGTRFDLETLCSAMTLSFAAALDTMDDLIAMGFINYHNNTYRFHHDRIQEAAYSLIPTEEKERLHYRIGQILLEGTAPDALGAKVFDIADQFNQARRSIISREMQYRVAELNLKAGIKAKESTAYSAAIIYLKNGMDLLPEQAWTEQYELVYGLYKERMEAEYLARNFEESERLFAALNQKARNKIDRARACHTMIVLYTTIGKIHEAIDLGVESVKMFGIRLPKNCGKGPVIIEILRFKRKLAKIQIEDILDFPVCTDQEIIAKCELYGRIGLPAYYANPNLFALTIFKGINGDLEHGLVYTSAFGFVAIATVIGGELGDFRTAYRLGEMALKLNEKMDDKRHAAKVNFVFGFLVMHWTRPLREGFDYFTKAYKIGLETGDFLYCGHSLNTLFGQRLMAGDNIDDILEEHSRFQDFQESVKDPFVANQYFYSRQLCLNLKGLTESPLSMNTPDYDYDRNVVSMRAQGNMLGVFILLMMQEKIHYLNRNYEEAYRIGFDIDPLLEFPKGCYYLVEHIFYRCLSLLAVYPGKTSSEKRKIMKILKGFKKKMRKWGESAPANNLHKYLLIQAEEASATRQHLQAADLYRQAIHSAREHGFLNNEAIANERAGMFYLGKKYEEIARVYLESAYRAYTQWGACGKAKEMEKAHPFLAVPTVQTRNGHDTDSVNASSGSSVNSTLLDLSTVMKVSQTISSEIMIDRLLGSIMKMAVMNAGAQKGIFILATNGQLTIEASRNEGQEEAVQMQSLPLEHYDELSTAVVHYVHRSGESVILGNAAQEGNFKNDPYFQRGKCKSVLAMPIVNKGEIFGILYMENNLITNAFTPERLELLGIISTQAAISIENARLFEQATTDGLTKLFGRRYFQLLLDREAERYKRYQRPFSLVMMDIDNFKRFNDTYGHQLGDEVLRTVAWTIKKNCRTVDLVARYGGEEFVVILPETDMKGSIIAAEKVRASVEGLAMAHGQETLRTTLSLGVATFPLHANEAEALVRSADAALYRSKRLGKNRISVGEKTDGSGIDEAYGRPPAFLPN